MHILGPIWTLCLLSILIPHCVYAQFQPIVLYNPISGNELDLGLLQTLPLRAAREIHVNDNVIQLPSMGLPCSCEGFICKCCLGIRFGGENQNLCLKIEYEWRVFGVRFYVEYNDRLVTTFGIGAKNIPDYCTSLIMPLPFFTCMRLSDVEIVDNDRSLNLCTSFVFKFLFSQLFEYKLSCMRLGPAGIRLLMPVNEDEITNTEVPQPDQLTFQSSDKLLSYDAQVQ